MRKFVLLFQREEGGAMLFVLSITIILNIVLGAFFFTGQVTTRAGGFRRERVAALNVAEAGKERFIARLKNDNILPNKKWTPFKNEPLGNGKYTVTCSTGVSTDTVVILSEGEEGGFKKRIEVLATKRRVLPIDSLSARIPAALMSRGAVSLTGSIDIDGRDHDSIAIIPDDTIGRGTFGVLTCGLFNINGNGKVWGNNKGPGTKKNYTTLKDTVYRENVFPCGIPSTPEAVLGLPAGALDKYKIKSKDLKLPFEGIVYVTESVGNINDNGISRGIFIVHNSTTSAVISKINGSFKFRGIIICDDIDKINGNAHIVGAVVILSPNPNFGNGGATILYSKRVLDNLDMYVSEMRNWTVEQLAWREISD
ncbi:MAG: hypothetical protein N2053_04640 [Chitinispirillaceae bacterium]|nr:hypothetical protein [Chitinispirillaceae bacterium]